MIDHIHILVQAGDGGHGCESFYHRNDRKALPDGGDGGNGGSIIFRAVKDAPPISQLRFHRHLIAESGAHGGNNRKRGKNAKDMIVLVPIGTHLFDLSRKLVIRDLVKDQDEVVVVKGGKGGAGNQGNKRQSPGEKGEAFELEITVRLTAEVVMVGLPNSGKTSLLNALSRAHAKVEAYPFTTKTPELGVVEFSGYERLTSCDLPSLYRSSHDGRGRGNEFLKHLEFAKCLLYVMDPLSTFAVSMAEGFKILKDEIKTYNENFMKIPSAVVINKIDLPEARDRIKKERWNPGIQKFLVSATTGEGMESLKEFLKAYAEKNT